MCDNESIMKHKQAAKLLCQLVLVDIMLSRGNLKKGGHFPLFLQGVRQGGFARTRPWQALAAFSRKLRFLRENDSHQQKKQKTGQRAEPLPNPTPSFLK
jgi:hypothetical protein